MSRTIKAGHVYRQYSKDGMPIADYKSSRLAHEATGVSLGSIARAAHGERKTGGGYLWRVVPEDLPWEPIQVDLSSKIGYHDKRPLIQLTLDGQVVAEYLSIAHASRALNISRRSISCAMTGAQKTAGGYKRKRVTIQVDFQDMGSHLSFMHKIRYNVKIIYSDLYKYLRKRA